MLSHYTPYPTLSDVYEFTVRHYLSLIEQYEAAGKKEAARFLKQQLKTIENA